MRLIDAEDLKARAREEIGGMEEPLASQFAILVEWLVDKTSTAYDVEKVVERLEEEKQTAYRTYESFENKVDLGRAFGAENAIEIVRKGGVE